MCMRRTASPRSWATDRLWILGLAAASSARGMVLVTTTLVSGLSASRFRGRAGQDRVGGAGPYFPGPVLGERPGRLGQGAGGVYHVVQDHRQLAR